MQTHNNILYSSCLPIHLYIIQNKFKPLLKIMQLPLIFELLSLIIRLWFIIQVIDPKELAK